MVPRAWFAVAVSLAMIGNAPAQVPKEAMLQARSLFGAGLTVAGTDRDVNAVSDGGTVRLIVRRPCPTPYTVQLLTTHSLFDVHKGDVLFVTLESRSTSKEGGVWQLHAQQSTSPWTGFFSLEAAPSSEWRRYNLKWRADRDVPADALEIAIHVSARPQELEFRSFEAVDLGAYAGALPYTKITYPGREADAPWRKEAEFRIDRYRKTSLTVRVVDRKGKPLPGVAVHIRQLRHAYEFGSFVEQPLLWQNEDGQRYRDWFLKAYNKATTPMYWADWGWENPEEYARYFQYPQWLKAHEIRTKAHVLIYPGWQFMPTRLRPLAENPPALWAAMEKHIREKLRATMPFRFVSWDVTNETRDLKDLPKVFGSEEIYVRLYKLAHSIDPNPTLYLNENTILTGGGRTEPQQAEFERMLRYLLAQGAPLQGIGMQAHFGQALTAPADIWRIVDRFAAFGLPIQITEFDLPIDDPDAQADYTRDLLTAWFAHPATTGFTMWGFWEGSMWQPAGALVDKNWNVRPNGHAWLELVKNKWWTDTTIATDHEGTVRTRVFKGDYEITSGPSMQRSTALKPTDIRLTR